VPPRVFGPLTSARDPDEHQALFCDLFGMEPLASVTFDQGPAAALFGGDVTGVELRLLGTPGCASGAVICRFSGPDSGTIRDGASPVDHDALKVIDFFAPDLEAAVAKARALGHDVSVSAEPYSMDGVPLREAHLGGPDGLRFAILGGPQREMRQYVELPDRLISDVLGVTSPVQDQHLAAAYYADVFGWRPVLQYTADGSAIATLVGLEADFRVTGVCMGSRSEETYVDLLDYGLPPGVGASLRGRSVAPRRGLLGLAVLVADLDAIRAAAPPGALGETVVFPAESGVAGAAVLTPPWGVPHLLLATERGLP
jgi:catechol 2,3-dioxygenase-like lactoylglutathione lyase family enzyme